VKTIDPRDPAKSIAWLGRHLSRTKLGLAFGAGGAKGYAHVGVLQVLEEAGYTVDYVAGSSMGAIVGAWLALGMDAQSIADTMRTAFDPPTVDKVFRLSLSGKSTGLQDLADICSRTTHGLSFSDLKLPLVVMAVDLNARQAAPIVDGLLSEALMAAVSVPGLIPPYIRGTQRLVDGLALVPVPAAAVREAGADIVVAVNTMSWDTLPAWPGEEPISSPPIPNGSRLLETLIEVLDLAQFDSSMRHAAMADVTITPRFGPGNWRDFHLHERFLAAGRLAAQSQLEKLASLSRPQPLPAETADRRM
jgi:NTE family protein